MVVSFEFCCLDDFVAYILTMYIIANESRVLNKNCIITMFVSRIGVHENREQIKCSAAQCIIVLGSNVQTG